MFWCCQYEYGQHSHAKSQHEGYVLSDEKTSYLKFVELPNLNEHIVKQHGAWLIRIHTVLNDILDRKISDLLNVLCTE
jgi:hypothetical protein